MWDYSRPPVGTPTCRYVYPAGHARNYPSIISCCIYGACSVESFVFIAVNREGSFFLVSTCVERIGFRSTYVPWFTSIRPGRRAPLSLVVVVARIDPTSYLPTSHHPSSRRPPRSRLSLSFFPSRLSTLYLSFAVSPPDPNSPMCSTYHLESGRSFARPVDSADFFFFSIDGTSRDEHFSGYVPV